MTKLDKLHELFDGATPIISRKEAQAMGLDRYFTGKPCKRRHVAERYVSNRACVECDQARNATNYVENREDVKARIAKWRAKNADKVKASDAKWRAENPDKILTAQAKWVANNPDKLRAKNARRRARRRHVVTTESADTIFRQMSQAEHFCFYCDAPILPGEADIDHLVPLSRLGPHAEINFVAACPTCNRSKYDRLPSEWEDMPAFGRERALEREQIVIEWAELDALGIEPRWIERKQMMDKA